MSDVWSIKKRRDSDTGEKRFGYYDQLRGRLFYEIDPPEVCVQARKPTLRKASIMSDGSPPPLPKGERRIVVNLWPAIKWLYKKITGKKIKDE